MAFPTQSTTEPDLLRPLLGVYPLIQLHRPGTLAPGGRDLSKAPASGRDWRNRPPLAPNEAESLSRQGFNIGLGLGPEFALPDRIFAALDIDRRHDEFSFGGYRKLLRWLRDLDLELGDFLVQKTGGGGRHFLFALEPGEYQGVVGRLRDFPFVEVKFRHQIVAAGSLHPSGRHYRIHPRSAPPGREALLAPEHPLAQALLVHRASVVMESTGEPDWTPEMLDEFLGNLDPTKFRGYDDWFNLMAGCHAATLGAGLHEFIAWSTSDPKYAHAAEDITSKWERLDPNKSNGRTARSLERLARERGFNVPRRPADDFKEVVGEPNDSGYGLIEPLETLDLEGIEAKRRRDGEITDSYKTSLHLMQQLQPRLLLAHNKLSDTFVFRGDDLPWKGLQQGQPRLDEGSAQLLRAFILRQFDVEISAANLKDAAETTARMNPFHPIVDYLDGLAWDGTERIDGAFGSLFGAEDCEYVRAVSRLFFVSAVRRAREPGCKYDTMPILEGPQGVGKSTTIRALCADPSWFTDASINLGPYADAAKAAIELESAWIYEMAELDAFTRAQATKMKAWLSRQRDDFKRPYDRFVTNRERTFVVIGTSNDSSYLTDTTGNRRYLPVGVGQCHPEHAERLRDQLWAEASAVEPKYGNLVIPRSLWATAGRMQDDRLNHHPWFDHLRRILEDLSYGPDGQRREPVERVHGSTLLDRLGVQSGRASQKDSKELRKLMPLLGYEYKASVRVDGKPGSGYVLKGTDTKDQD